MEWDTSRIRALRAALRLPRDRFAERLGAAPKTVQNWEDGRNAPGLALLRALDEAWESAASEQRERFFAFLSPDEKAHERRIAPLGEVVSAVGPDQLDRLAAAEGDVSRGDHGV